MKEPLLQTITTHSRIKTYFDIIISQIDDGRIILLSNFGLLRDEDILPDENIDISDMVDEDLFPACGIYTVDIEVHWLKSDDLYSGGYEWDFTIGVENIRQLILF